MGWLTDWLPQPGEASRELQLVFLTLCALTILAIVLLGIMAAAQRRRLSTAEAKITKMETARRQNEERLEGLTTAVNRLATHHHVGASMGHDYEGDALDDHAVIIEQAVDSSIPWVNPVHAIHDHPEIVRDTDLPLDRFADPAPVSDPNIPAVRPDGRALPPVPPDPRRLRQYVAPARTITSEPITAVDAPITVQHAAEAPRPARHAAPAVGRHAAG
jgi:hypothetical protein